MVKRARQQFLSAFDSEPNIDIQYELIPHVARLCLSGMPTSRRQMSKVDIAEGASESFTEPTPLIRAVGWERGRGENSDVSVFSLEPNPTYSILLNFGIISPLV